MKTPLVVLALFSFLLPITSYAQGRPGTGTPGGSRPSTPSNTSPTTRPTNPMPEIDRSVFVSGKVVLPDGSPVTESVSIESICSSRKRIETYTDSHGNFSFELKKKNSNMAMQSADISSYDDGISRNNEPFAYQNCELTAILPGFTSEVVQLAASMSSAMESTDVGRIVLHPMGQASASALSVTSLAAPNSAKKAMDKAHEQEKKNKIPEAELALQKAVGIYPQYAAAWTELGRLQYMDHKDADAKHSFEQAVAADAKYAKPYLGLSQLAIQSNEWQNALDLTGKVLALNSSYPSAWFLHAIAQYNLQQYDAAEASAHSGLKTDTEHSIPRLEHLLGLISSYKQDYVAAAEHMRAFLQYSHQPSEIAEGQKMLAEIERRSAQAKLGTAPAK